MWIKDISTYVCMSDSQMILSDNPFPVGRSTTSTDAAKMNEIDTPLDFIIGLWSNLKNNIFICKKFVWGRKIRKICVSNY